MKKFFIQIVFLFISVFAFAQTQEEILETYLDENYQRLGLQKSDVDSWRIESSGTLSDESIKTIYVLQQYQGIDIFRAQSTAAINDNSVNYFANGFIANVSQKINSTVPTLTVLNALEQAYTLLNIQKTEPFEIIESNGNKFKISNALNFENPVIGNLVFHQSKNKDFRLSWDFAIDTPAHNHFWSVRIDALTGELLEKNDLVISCNFTESRSCLTHNHINVAKTFMPKEVNLFNQNSFVAPLNVQGGSYKVVPFNYESPNHIARQLIVNPENATASPKGWHDANSMTTNTASLKYIYTRGNNAWARADYGDVEPTTHSTTNTANGYSPSNSSNVYDYAYAGQSVAAPTYIDAAVTNLFYMNNIMHDVWYQYGFNEANGNFQQSNYSYGASGNDFVYADAQDGSTKATPDLNNANFATPIDGSKPRMQMYLWSYRKITQLLTINSPVDIAGSKYTADNGFNPGHVDVPVAPNMLQTDLVLINDGTPDVGMTDNADGCSAAVNASAVSGKICVVRRSVSVANGGDPCSFVQKVLNAQAAGAVAVVIVNNDATTPNSPIGMSGADATITIPVISVSPTVGEEIIAKLKAGITVNAKIQSAEPLPLFVNTDGDFDNGVIAHEFGHGISTRLAGGRLNSSCLQNYEQMGEGWSDWFAMMMQIKVGDVGSTPRGLATFVMNQPTTGGGLRSYPYTTDMTINPLTFNNSNEPIPDDPANTGYRYVIGDFWATTLWDLTWAYIDKYGYNSDIYTGTGGNNKVMKLVLDAIKLQPCSPSIVNGRDALFQADQATTGGQDYCMIAEVFRRRGVGLNATSGSSGDSDDQVEDFTPFPAGPNCVLKENSTNSIEGNLRIYPNPTKNILNIELSNGLNLIEAEIFDITGKKVISNISNLNINTSNLESGMYIIKLNIDGIILNKKFIKQ